MGDLDIVVATLRLLVWGRMHEKKAHIWMFCTHIGDRTGKHGMDDGQEEEGEEGRVEGSFNGRERKRNVRRSYSEIRHTSPK